MCVCVWLCVCVCVCVCVWVGVTRVADHPPGSGAVLACREAMLLAGANGRRPGRVSILVVAQGAAPPGRATQPPAIDADRRVMVGTNKYGHQK